jgi:FAD/FMN-containing dehydrogenase
VQQSTVQPACIVTPQTAHDVSDSVVLLKKVHQGGRSCPFAVLSGGHTSWPGASNIAGGVVLDLRALNSVEISADKSIVSVGVGAPWDAVYEKLDPLGLSVNGGRCSGVGGFDYHTPSFHMLTLIPWDKASVA